MQYILLDIHNSASIIIVVIYSTHIHKQAKRASASDIKQISACATFLYITSKYVCNDDSPITMLWP